jgi:hypothetical protein
MSVLHQFEEDGRLDLSLKSTTSTMVDVSPQPQIESYSDGEEVVEETCTFGEGDLLEDDIRKNQRLDTVSAISSLRLTASDLSRMRIPLCRLVPMTMVRPTLACDLVLLEQQFINCYEEGARVFYVSIADEQGHTDVFTPAEKNKWGPLWNIVNDEFNKQLTSQAALKHLVDHKFYVCDGNHRRIAWMNHIERLHSSERNWHISVDSIVLDTRNRIGLAMQVMHDINK